MGKKQKSAATAAEKQLRAAVGKLQAQLAVAEKSAEKWKGRAKDHKSMAAGIMSELGSARRRLAKAEASVSKWKDRAQAKVGTRPRLTAVPDPEPETARAPGAAVPDDTWTVTALRAEARSRGLTNYSRKNKAQLLEELRG